MPVTTHALEALTEKLDACEGCVTREQAEAWLRESALSLDDVAEYVRFDPHLYQRGTVKRTDSYELLVVCWDSGQRSTLHDHFGSICAFRVVQGKATELQFARSSAGYLYPTEVEHLPVGSVQGCQGQEVHQLCNLESEGLVSVHIYSPPLTASRSYGLDETPFGGYAELQERVARRAAQAKSASVTPSSFSET